MLITPLFAVIGSASLLSFTYAQGLSDLLGSLNGTACFTAIASVGDQCAGVGIPVLQSLSSSSVGTRPAFTRRDTYDQRFFTMGINSTQIDKVCSAGCQTAIRKAGSECTTWIQNLAKGPLGGSLGGNVDASVIFKGVTDFTGILCLKDSVGNYCTQQIANTDPQVYAKVVQAVLAALEGNTTVDATLPDVLNSVCTECLGKLVQAWASLAGANNNDIDSGLQVLALACATNPSTQSYCIKEYAQFTSSIVQAEGSAAALAAVRKGVCDNPSPCLGTLSTILRSVDSEDRRSERVALQVLSSADLCALNGNGTCLDSYASVADATYACIQSLNEKTLSGLTCSNLPQVCKTALNKLEDVGCCARPIASALGSSFLPKVVPCRGSISNATCAAPPAVGNLTFSLTVPNLNFTRVQNLGLVDRVTNAIIQDIAQRFQIPAVMVSVQNAQPSTDGQGTTLVVTIAFPSDATRDRAQSGGNVPLTNTASSLVSASDAMVDPALGLNANVQQKSTNVKGDGARTVAFSGFAVIAVGLVSGLLAF